jgi:antitoxin HicB
LAVLGYPITLSSDDNGTVLVTCPDLPEVTTFGIDPADALARAGDAIEAALASRIAASEDVPEPSPAGGPGPIASLPALTLAKVGLYRAMRGEGLTIAMLAARLGTSESAVRRLVNLDQRTPLPEIEAGLRAMGRRLGIEVWKAA